MASNVVYMEQIDREIVQHKEWWVVAYYTTLYTSVDPAHTKAHRETAKHEVFDTSEKAMIFCLERIADLTEESCIARRITVEEKNATLQKVKDLESKLLSARDRFEKTDALKAGAKKVVEELAVSIEVSAKSLAAKTKANNDLLQKTAKATEATEKFKAVKAEVTEFIESRPSGEIHHVWAPDKADAVVRVRSLDNNLIFGVGAAIPMPEVLKSARRLPIDPNPVDGKHFVLTDKEKRQYERGKPMSDVLNARPADVLSAPGFARTKTLAEINAELAKSGVLKQNTTNRPHAVNISGMSAEEKKKYLDELEAKKKVDSIQRATKLPKSAWKLTDDGKVNFMGAIYTVESAMSLFKTMYPLDAEALNIAVKSVAKGTAAVTPGLKPATVDPNVLNSILANLGKAPVDVPPAPPAAPAETGNSEVDALIAGIEAQYNKGHITEEERDNRIAEAKGLLEPVAAGDIDPNLPDGEDIPF
jgi:hypothetical protein